MTTRFEFHAPLAKVDHEKRQIHAVVYQSDVIDSQGEFISANELEKAVHLAATKGIVFRNGHGGPTIKGAALVENFLADVQSAEGVRKQWRVVGKFEPNPWEPIRSGRVKAVSMGGVAVRKAATLHGRNAHELVDVVLDHIALVERGASPGSDFVAKSSLEASIADAIARVRAVTELVNTPLPNVAKTHDAVVEKGERVAVLKHRIGTLNARLERLWESGGPHAREIEQRLLLDIDAAQTELEVLRGPVAFGFDNFAARGGTSQRLDASLAMTDDLLGVRRRPAVEKAAAELDLSSDLRL